MEANPDARTSCRSCRNNGSVCVPRRFCKGLLRLAASPERKRGDVSREGIPALTLGAVRLPSEYAPIGQTGPLPNVGLVIESSDLGSQAGAARRGVVNGDRLCAYRA